ncbi:sulfur carrier protein [Desulfonatronum thiosulfatophilum]|uniref:Sulfur carrier protein n=1 Tax=Desulfonatronum thiosulfatophilum TaxID=617002 RepID=A0A1G6AW62_9BACT|nr:MoaD/ThiS family protein [Desulfonatronum thiosulfatophilum]SDB12539.1 sulfur carrier protein [Desulfonatronum thiosulfatophilum]
MISVRLEPKGREIEITKASTVLQLLRQLGLGPNAALVIRNKELLTPDRRINAGDTIIVRGVSSRG